MNPFSLLWKYKFYASLFLLVATIVVTTAFLSRQERIREREAKSALQTQSNRLLRK